MRVVAAAAVAAVAAVVAVTAMPDGCSREGDVAAVLLPACPLVIGDRVAGDGEDDDDADADEEPATAALGKDEDGQDAGSCVGALGSWSSSACCCCCCPGEAATGPAAAVAGVGVAIVAVDSVAGPACRSRLPSSCRAGCSRAISIVAIVSTLLLFYRRDETRADERPTAACETGMVRRLSGAALAASLMEREGEGEQKRERGKRGRSVCVRASRWGPKLHDDMRRKKHRFRAA
ncbi:hypothetical protein FA10DRAFT_265529, partial [Acaromyces ingoldii]